MAKRPVFTPTATGDALTEERAFEFTWYAGFSVAQKQRSIASLHEAAKREGLAPLLEISSKSPEPEGVALSAFNLPYRSPDGRSLPVEVAFQGSKVFEDGGPFEDLYDESPRDAKRDARLRESGRLTGFRLFGTEFPSEPKTAFYDWIYVSAVSQSPHLGEAILQYEGFTDIEFNPSRSLNCQARAAALYVALSRRGLLVSVVDSVEEYLRLRTGEATQSGQMRLI